MLQYGEKKVHFKTKGRPELQNYVPSDRGDEDPRSRVQKSQELGMLESSEAYIENVAAA